MEKYYELKLSKRKGWNYAIVEICVYDSGQRREVEINWTDSFAEGQEKVDAWNKSVG